MKDYEFFKRWAVRFMKMLIMDFGVSVYDAAAIIGNAGHESEGFEDFTEDNPLIKGSRGGYGIMMWTGPRRRAFEAYCARNNLKPSDMMVNYKFLFVELNGPEGKVLPKLKAARTLDAKVEVFSKVFLRPGIPHMEGRKIWARRALAAWNEANKVPTDSVVTSSTKPRWSFWDWIKSWFS